MLTPEELAVSDPLPFGPGQECYMYIFARHEKSGKLTHMASDNPDYPTKRGPLWFTEQQLERGYPGEKFTVYLRDARPALVRLAAEAPLELP